ncbi:MAG: N-acylglucosamine 2-epimerase [Planctomycetota bacterium]|jgi:N-acylglucosamine 2-epimerase
MDSKRIDELIAAYRDGLLEDTLPFWMKHAVDREQGGFLFCLDRDGSILDTDKGMWQQCRFTWLLATLYTTVERRPEWLELARHGVDFIRSHGFDQDGRMFFQVARDGAPLRKRRYVFTESFGAIALAAYARASGDDQAADEARGLFREMLRLGTTPGLIEPKINAQTRPCKGIGFPMITLATAQVLRAELQDPLADEWIDRSIDEIRRDFVKPELEVVMETVGPRGELIDHFDGRTLNPGHALEAAWFILAEARHRADDAELVKLGSSMVDWMWRRGWDAEHGGLFYFRDLNGGPVQEYWHDMKFWWPHNEAVLATLMAYRATGEARFAEWHRLVHDWSHRAFADPEQGEWFGYLHRDGSRSVSLKGNMWKGPFHLPRMQLVAWKTLEEMRAGPV